jgi:hypothetical protein
MNEDWRDLAPSEFEIVEEGGISFSSVEAEGLTLLGSALVGLSRAEWGVEDKRVDHSAGIENKMNESADSSATEMETHEGDGGFPLLASRSSEKGSSWQKNGDEWGRRRGSALLLVSK